MPLPDRLTPFSRELPAPEEVAPWVEAIIRLWDDHAWYEEQSRRALVEARRWAPEVLEPQYVEFFQNVRPKAVRPGAPSTPVTPMMRSRATFGAFLNAMGLTATGAEIGVQNGYFSRQVLDKWRGQLLYMIDVWQPLEGYRDVANVPAAEQAERMCRAIRQVVPHWSRVRVIQELSENAARLIPDGSLDWVYIDANHDFANVTRDLETWTPKVKAGGLIAGHDYLDGVMTIAGVETVFEVKRAVNEYFGVGQVGETQEVFPTWFIMKP